MIVNSQASGGSGGGGSVELVTGQVLQFGSMEGSATIYYVNPDMTVADISSIDNNGESFEVVKGTILFAVSLIGGIFAANGGLSVIAHVDSSEALTCYEVTANFAIAYVPPEKATQ